MFSAGQYIDQQKKDINNFCLVFENIILSNLNLTEIFLSNFQAIIFLFQKVLNHKGLGGVPRPVCVFTLRSIDKLLSFQGEKI